MFELEDMSSGFHDIFLSKYADSSGPILDLYISDSMQDMLDIDIRSEVATVVGGSNEFTSLIGDLPSSFDLEMSANDLDIPWSGGPKWSSGNDIYADVGACVNPNSVMPLITSSILNSPKSQLNLNTSNYHITSSPPASPKEKKSHLTFSPNQMKIPTMQEMKRIQATPSCNINSKSSLDSVKKDLGMDLKDEKIVKLLPNVLPASILSSSNTIKLAPGIGGLTFANSVAYNKLKQQAAINNVKSTNANNLITQIKKERDSSPHRQNIAINGNGMVNTTVYSTTSNSNSNVHSTNLSNGNHTNNSSPKIIARNILLQTKNGIIANGVTNNATIIGQNNHSAPSTNKNKIKPTGHEYPKPAYSYSCLIAMALKNSRSGSLPVSEIYSFMCEHFPYFKTAPNGWKNSVRHNLSLNKCFEKIEKPATNAGQRKGCLWAMNPSKISKMDEEVQKWSRKDPMAIRKAMVYPENLESLERGEMKHGSTGESDNENDNQSDIEENSDCEQYDDHLIETPESIEEDDDQEKEFDIEVADFYELADSKDITLHMDNIRQAELVDLTENDLPTAKRARRVDINYSIGPAGAFGGHQIVHSSSPLHVQQHQQQQHHSRRKMQLVNRIV